jgi:hypothetical protein
MLRKADNTFVSDHMLPAELLAAARPRLADALGQVGFTWVCTFARTFAQG